MIGINVIFSEKSVISILKLLLTPTNISDLVLLESDEQIKIRSLLLKDLSLRRACIMTHRTRSPPPPLSQFGWKKASNSSFLQPTLFRLDLIETLITAMRTMAATNAINSVGPRLKRPPTEKSVVIIHDIVGFHDDAIRQCNISGRSLERLRITFLVSPKVLKISGISTVFGGAEKMKASNIEVYEVWHCLEKKVAPRGIRTHDTRFKVWGANHYTMGAHICPAILNNVYQKFTLVNHLERTV